MKKDMRFTCKKCKKILYADVDVYPSTPWFGLNVIMMTVCCPKCGEYYYPILDKNKKFSGTFA